MEAADEIGLAVIATTFTLIAVFLPTAFMSGIAGKFFKQFGWTAAIAVFCSPGGGAHAHAHDGGLHLASRHRAGDPQRSRAGCGTYLRWAALVHQAPLDDLRRHALRSLSARSR